MKNIFSAKRLHWLVLPILCGFYTSKNTTAEARGFFNVGVYITIKVLYVKSHWYGRYFFNSVATATILERLPSCTQHSG